MFWGRLMMSNRKSKSENYIKSGPCLIRSPSKIPGEAGPEVKQSLDFSVIAWIAEEATRWSTGVRRRERKNYLQPPREPQLTC